MFQLRDYQIDLAQRGCKILQKYKLLALMAECRVGKTLTTLETIRLYGAKSALFLTKKKAQASIRSDYEALNPGYEITIINHESMHKALDDYDFVVVDECHTYSGFPRPSVRYKAFKERFSHLPMILVSATFSPESYSQLYHVFSLSNYSPFKHKNFYAWAKEFVNITQKVLPQGTINDYTKADYSKIEPLISPFTLSFTQKDANFLVTLHEHFCEVPMASICKTIADRLMSDGVVQGKTGTISAENPAALLQKVHQIHSGSIILDEVEGEPRQSVMLSDAKARYIAETWPTEKLVIFYVFKHELQVILSVLGDRVTTDLETFQTTDKSIALQVVSGREGLNLSVGELIIFYNIQHSATSYYQARDRLTTSTRRESHIYWLFSIGGIEEKIYKVVMGKKSYTSSHFKKDYAKCLSHKYRATSSANTKARATLS
jgi:hypothetical protein